MARNKKKFLLIIPILIVLLSALAVAGLWGQRYMRKTYITIGDVRYRRDVTSLELSSLDQLEEVQTLKNLELLDLRGTGLTAAQHAQLLEAMPGCEILWDPPFQGSFYSVDTEGFTIYTLSDSGIAELAAFPNLKTIDASACRDYAQLTVLMERYPDCQVTYQVAIGGEDYAPDVQTLSLTDANAAELLETLPFLSELQSVTLTGTLPEAEELTALTAAFPAVEFHWNVTILGTEYPNTTTELDFSGIPLDSVEEIEAGVAYLPALTKVEMNNCGIDNETMDALNRRHETVQFIWTLTIGTIEVRTDETAFMPAKFNTTISNADAQDLKYLTELIVLDLGHHTNITDSSFLQYLTKLQFLLLADTGISDISGVENMKELKYVELFMSAVTDYTPLLECTALEDLNLYYTHGDPEVVAQMTWLKRLWWGLSGMSVSEMVEFAKRLPDTEVNMFHTEATNDGWREGALYFEMRDLLGMSYME